MPKTRRPTDPRTQTRQITLSFENQPVMAEFVKSITDGNGEPSLTQICCFGTRGDGKTIGALTGMIAHAQAHALAGHELPVPWMGVTDTFTSHKLKTVRSLENPVFQGCWRFSEGDHIATFYAGNPPIPHVKLDLFGIEDQGARDRVRMETCGVWFEEPAPATVMVQSSGVDYDSWKLATTSQRIPSHFKPAVITSNYPDEDHWTWEHFVTSPTPGTRYFRIPPGERASKEDREKWIRDLGDRPDLLRRLLLGEPGVIMLGDQVAKGFTKQDHTTTRQIHLTPGAPLYFGFDFGHTPTCVIAQPQRGCLIVKAGLWLKNSGMAQLMEDLVLPWLGRYAPWVLRNPDDCALIGHDPSQGTITKAKGNEADIENSALGMIQQQLGGGDFEPGAIAWEIRKDVLVRIFNRAHGVLIEENEYTKDLIRALDGRWYFAKSHQGTLTSDRPKKPNSPWSDLGDAFTYLLCRYGVGGQNENANKPLKVLTNLNTDEYESNRVLNVVTNQEY